MLEPPPRDPIRRPVAMLQVKVPPKKKDTPPEEPPEPEVEVEPGQIVEIAPPEVQERPEESEYLANVNSKVVEETRVERVEVNPEVLAPTWSKDQRYQQEDLLDINVEKPSTGATVGNDKFDPDRDGNRSALPSRWLLTNKEGLQDPVPASHMAAALSGAPQNDRLDERLGDQVALNARDFIYADYFNRIRRLVNYYWKQNLDNLPDSVRIVNPRYRTLVDVVLDRDGALELVTVTDPSGVGELDDAVVRAFRLAGPFPNPPTGLVQNDGRVYLPSMDFTVSFGQASMVYQGVDPRAGVQFPGLLKAPR
jgi:TonB family protein